MAAVVCVGILARRLSVWPECMAMKCNQRQQMWVHSLRHVTDADVVYSDDVGDSWRKVHDTMQIGNACSKTSVSSSLRARCRKCFALRR